MEYPLHCWPLLAEGRLGRQIFGTIRRRMESWLLPAG